MRSPPCHTQAPDASSNRSAAGTSASPAWWAASRADDSASAASPANNSAAAGSAGSAASAAAAATATAADEIASNTPARCRHAAARGETCTARRSHTARAARRRPTSCARSACAARRPNPSSENRVTSRPRHPLGSVLATVPARWRAHTNAPTASSKRRGWPTSTVVRRSSTAIPRSCTPSCAIKAEMWLVLYFADQCAPRRARSRGLG